MTTHANLPADNLDDLIAWEAALDRSISGISLADDRTTRFADQGAHDATPTYHFVLDELFGQVPFDAHTRLLDVGCSVGRVLAHFVWRGYPGEATGVELDPELATIAQAWSARHSHLHVIQGNVLDFDLGAYNLFYLFNPFAPNVLQQFIEAIEAQARTSCTLIHMSDNGDTWHYVGRPGWTELASGRIQHFRNARGRQVAAYDDPQHYTIWRYERS